jgi:hypothetical protein
MHPANHGPPAWGLPLKAWHGERKLTVSLPLEGSPTTMAGRHGHFSLASPERQAKQMVLARVRCHYSDHGA